MQDIDLSLPRLHEKVEGRSRMFLQSLRNEGCLYRRTQSTNPIIDMSMIHEPLSTRSSVMELTPSDSKVPALEGVQPFDISMARFLDETGDEQSVLQRRHGMFKIVPRIEKGSWLIKQAVGQTPVLLGKKLTTKYFRSSPLIIQI